jgi:hypothetical protein
MSLFVTMFMTVNCKQNKYTVVYSLVRVDDPAPFAPFAPLRETVFHRAVAKDAKTRV